MIKNRKELENLWHFKKQWIEIIEEEEKTFKGKNLETRLEELVKDKKLPSGALRTWKLINSCEKDNFTCLNKLNDIVKDNFAKKGTHLENFECLKPEQFKHVKHLAVDKKDSFAILETGGGKSLIFQLAGLMVEGTVIVISPLVALIKQQVADLNQMYNIPAVCIASKALKIGDMESDEDDDDEDDESVLEKETEKLEDNHDIENEKKGWLTRRKAYREIAEGKRKIVYVTPERFRSPHFIRLLRRLSVSLIILDEVHCLSMWGRSFRPSYIDIKPIIEMIRNWANKDQADTKAGRKQIRYPIIGVFTATATNQVKKDIIKLLDLNLGTDEEKEVFDIFPQKKENFHYQFIKFPNPLKNNDNWEKGSAFFLPAQEWEMKGDTLEKILKYEFKLSETKLEADPLPFGIIFCTKIANVDKIYNELCYGKLSKYFHNMVTKYYGPMDDKDKNKNADDFIKGNKRIMIATNAFGMGIDKDDIRFIIHYNCPSCLEDYIQETGRAGRNPEVEANCYLLYNSKMDKKPLKPYTDGQFKGLRLLYEKMRNYEIMTFVSEHGIYEKRYYLGINNVKFEKIGDDLAEKLKGTGDLEEYLKSQIELALKELKEIHENETRLSKIENDLASFYPSTLKGNKNELLKTRLRKRKELCIKILDRYPKLISNEVLINIQNICPDLYGKGNENRLDNNFYIFGQKKKEAKITLHIPGGTDDLFSLVKKLREKNPETDSEKLFRFKQLLIEKCMPDMQEKLSAITENDIIGVIIPLGIKEIYYTQAEYEFILKEFGENELKDLKGIVVLPQVNGTPKGITKEIKTPKAKFEMDAGTTAKIMSRLKKTDRLLDKKKADAFRQAIREKLEGITERKIRSVNAYDRIKAVICIPGQRQPVYKSFDEKSLSQSDIASINGVAIFGGDDKTIRLKCTEMKNEDSLRVLRELSSILQEIGNRIATEKKDIVKRILIEEDETLKPMKANDIICVLHTARPVYDISMMESECQKNRLKKPSFLLVNRCIIAESIRKGLYQMGYDNCSKPILLSNKLKNEKICASYMLQYDGIPYSENDVENKLTYFDMMVADAVYTLEMYDLEICAKNIYGALCGDFRVSLTKEKKEMILSCIEKMMKTTITLQIYGNICKTGWIWYNEDLYGEYSLKREGEITEPFLPLEEKGQIYVPASLPVKVSGINNSDKVYRTITHIPILYRLAEGMMQFYTFPLYKLSLMGKNWDMYDHPLYFEIKKLVYGNYIEKIANQYFTRPDCSVERVILTHFLLRRADNIPSQKRFLMKRNTLSPDIKLFENHDYAGRTLYDSESLFVRLFNGTGIEKMNKYSRKRKLDNILEDYGLYYIRTEKDKELAIAILTGAWKPQIPVIYVSMDDSGTVYTNYKNLANYMPIPAYIIVEASLMVSGMIHEEAKKSNGKILFHDVWIFLPEMEVITEDHSVIEDRNAKLIINNVNYKTIISKIWNKWGKNKYNELSFCLKKNCLKYILGKMREYRILDYIDSSLMKYEILKRGKITLRSLYKSNRDPESWESVDSVIRKIPEMDPMEMALIFTGLVKKYNVIKDSEDNSGLKKEQKTLVFFIRKFGMYIIKSTLTLKKWQENIYSIKEGNYIFSSPSNNSYSNGILQEYYKESVSRLWDYYWAYEIKYGNLTSCLQAKEEYLNRKDQLIASLNKAINISKEYETSHKVIHLPCKIVPQKTKHKNRIESSDDVNNLRKKLSSWIDSFDNEIKIKEICATMWSNYGGPDFLAVDDPILKIDKWIQDKNTQDTP